MKKKTKNPNIQPNGDNLLMIYKDGKFINVPDQKIITSPLHRNFLIICEYGDWSPFLTWPEIQMRIVNIEKDYPPGTKPNWFFRIVERL